MRILQLFPKVNTFSITSKIAAGFTLPLILMIVVSTSIYLSTLSLISTNNWVLHTQKVIANGHLLEKLIVDMETGERGFLITGKDNFLEPYDLAKERWDITIIDSKKRVSDNPKQVENLVKIDKNQKRWLKLAATPEIYARRQFNQGKATMNDVAVMIEKETGKNIIDKIRHQIDEFIAIEEELIKIRSFKSDKAINTSFYRTILGTIVAMIIAFIAAYFLLKTIVASLSKLGLAVKGVADGDLSIRISMDNDDELGMLAHSFNQMTGRLFKANELMIKSQRDLESQAIILEKERLKAEASTVAKTQFLSTMSHEIRTPMNGVIGMAQLLEDTPLNDEQKDYLRTITQSGNNLLSIINDILDFSKLEAEMVTFEAISFDLERVCQESLELVAGNASNKKLEFIFNYHPDCPRCFIADPSRIRQILLNLLGNSVKFTEKGYIELGVFYQSSDDQLVIKIKDTGIGIKPNKLTHLFDEFTQADSTTTRKYGGTGLGLAITKKLVDLMDGGLTVESVYGEGTTFIITVQLKKAKKSKRIIESSLEAARILIVDDNKENLHIYKSIVEHMGAVVTILSDSTQVISLLQNAVEDNKPYKIALLDNKMPSISGMELGIQIRNTPQFNDLKLIIFSTIGQKGDASLYSRAGFNGYLNKLISYDKLRMILSAVLKHRAGYPIITQHLVEDVRQSGAGAGAGAGAAILLVEDVKPNQIIAKKFLTSMGANVDIANHGQEAVEAYKNKSYDLIFMDCRMPIMDGYTATRTIRQIEKDNNKTQMPIIALTANASSDDKVLCEQSGMNDVVTKPFKRADLSDCLKQWLGLRSDSVEPLSLSDSGLNPIDISVYKQLHDDMGDDIHDIIDAIYDSIQSNLDDLKKHQTASIESMIMCVHSIKSTAANLGALKLSDMAKNLEHELKTHSAKDLDFSVTQLHHEYERVKKYTKTI